MDLPKNSESVSISLPSWLWEAIDAYAERTGMSRSGVLLIASRRLLLAEVMDKKSTWEQLYQTLSGKS